METFAFVNQKGGVGKTTFAVHFAAYLAERGRSVFVLDVEQTLRIRTGETGEEAL